MASSACPSAPRCPAISPRAGTAPKRASTTSRCAWRSPVRRGNPTPAPCPGPAFAPARWRSRSCLPSWPGPPRGGWHTGAGVDRARARSRRGLPLWEEDSYRLWTRLPWGGTARLYPFGTSGAGVPTRATRPPLWVEITVGRQFAAGETRASEEVTIVDSAIAFDAQAVIPPRRVTVRMSLVRGDTASSQRTVDFIPEAPGRRVSFVLGGETFDFDVTLERPEPPRTRRDSALAVDADVVCLRLLVPGSSGPARVRCGRLDNVARRLALVEGDTLVATFAWPAVR